MSDYTPITDFSAKDNLTTGDPEKIISGADIDAETAAIQTAIATKYDSADVASQAQAEAVGPAASNSVLMTPLAVYYVLNENGGLLYDIQGLADPNADRIMFWDDSAGSVAFLQASTGLTLSGTTLTTNDSAIVHDSLSGFVANEHINHSSVSVIAANGGLAASNNDLTSNIGLSLDISTLTDFGTTAGVDLDTDTLAISDGGTEKEVLASQLVTPEIGTTVTGTTDTLAETDFGKLINYSSTSTVTITLPNGLKTGFWCVLRKTGATGNVTISATTTLQTAGGLDTWATQYAVVTVLHLGSNVWAAWGGLES